MEQKELLQIRKAAKKRKPHFVVKASAFSARVKKRWRFPRGRHSPIRQEHKGKPKLVSIGYGSPRAVKGLHHSGLQPIVVCNAKGLLALDQQTQGAVISGRLGKRKRLELLQLAEKEKIFLLNVKDVPAAVSSIQESLAARKKVKAEKQKEKSKKQQEKEKKAEKKKKEEEQEKKTKDSQSLEESVGGKEDKQELERKEAEKTLTKPQ